MDGPRRYAKQLVEPVGSGKKEKLAREIVPTSNKVDELVCKMYGLSEEESRIVEGAG